MGHEAVCPARESARRSRQLYNLKTDPGETTNLYLEETERAQMLKTKLEEFKRSGRSAPRN